MLLFHAKDRAAVARVLRPGSPLITVAVRGDRSSSLGLADFELVQNREQSGARSFYLPHWPQPGLVPRDDSRGERCERIAFKGYLENLHPDFRDERWAAFLCGLGITWVVDAVPFARGANERAALAWPDYRTVDAVLAVRPARVAAGSKPATKLYNAWLAGVPALLGVEPGYRALRRSALDYLEVDGFASAAVAVRRLRDEPGLYRAMVERGRARAGEFSVAAVTAAWRTMLAETLPERMRQAGIAPGGAPAGARRLRRALSRIAALARSR